MNNIALLEEIILNLQYQQKRICDILLNSNTIPDENYFKLNKISINLLNEILNFKKEISYLKINS
jgi:hypothetical protein